MNIEFLVTGNLIMATRLLFLGRDRPLSLTTALWLSAIQLLALVPLNVTAAWYLLAGLLPAVNLGLYAREGLLGGKSDGLRFLSLLLLLIVTSVIFAQQFNPGLRSETHEVVQLLAEHSLLLAWVGQFGASKVLLISFGLLLLVLEVNFLIRVIFSLSGMVPDDIAVKAGGENADGGFTVREYNAGRIIGILERMLILFFVLVDQFTAIAFIIAAKGIARFKELDQREFAEYVLIGTLLSTTLAIVVGVVVKMGLR